MLTRWLVILMLLALPLANAASSVCACPDEAVPAAHACCSQAPTLAADSCDACACGCSDQAAAQSDPACDAAHIAVCPSHLGRDCSGCGCTWRTGFPNAPIPTRARQVNTDHSTLPIPPVVRVPAFDFGRERMRAPRSSAASWLARCGTSIDRRVALSSWTI